jgi:hypothetical protein
VENLDKQLSYEEHKIIIEQSKQSDLTKEIALALPELKQVKNGKIQPLSLEDI